MTDLLLASHAVPIPGVLGKFLETASIAYVGTRDLDLTPRVHWACGWAQEPDPCRLAFFVAKPFGAGFVRGVERCRRVALTIEHIGPHETYQFKGDLAATRAPTPEDLRAAEACRVRFARDVLELDQRHGFTTPMLRHYLGAAEITAVIEVHEIFRQTPGPGAGRRLVPPEEAP